jgi:hypothetical protein
MDMRGRGGSVAGAAEDGEEVVVAEVEAPALVAEAEL